MYTHAKQCNAWKEKIKDKIKIFFPADMLFQCENVKSFVLSHSTLAVNWKIQGGIDNAAAAVAAQQNRKLIYLCIYRHGKRGYAETWGASERHQWQNEEHLYITLSWGHVHPFILNYLRHNNKLNAIIEIIVIYCITRRMRRNRWSKKHNNKKNEGKCCNVMPSHLHGIGKTSLAMDCLRTRNPITAYNWP